MGGWVGGCVGGWDVPSLLEDERDERGRGVVIERLSRVLLIERVVKGKVGVVEVLGDPVHPELAVVHHDHRVEASDLFKEEKRWVGGWLRLRRFE